MLYGSESCFITKSHMKHIPNLGKEQSGEGVKINILNA